MKPREYSSNPKRIVIFFFLDFSQKLKRDLRVFEEAQLEELVVVVSCFSVGDRGDDCLVWKPSSTGQFSVGSLYKFMVSFGLEEDLCLGRIWRVKGCLESGGFCVARPWYGRCGLLAMILRKAGCGEVLRNDKGHILAIFSGPLGCIDSIEVEVQAIRHVLVVLWELELEWRSCSCVIIESYSVVAVSWVLHLERQPWK
ncbi:hypothetical protein V6N13_020010 [Hibiscus sabdariffa]